METFKVTWHTYTPEGFASRGGYTIVYSSDKRGARKALRQGIDLWRGEKLKVLAVEKI